MSPCLVPQVIVCACCGSQHQHIPQWDHTVGLLLEEAGNHDTWSSPHDSFRWPTFFAVQIQNCCKTKHTCSFFLPSSSRESSEFSKSPISPFHSVSSWKSRDFLLCFPSLQWTPMPPECGITREGCLPRSRTKKSKVSTMLTSSLLLHWFYSHKKSLHS